MTVFKPTCTAFDLTQQIGFVSRTRRGGKIIAIGSLMSLLGLLPYPR